KSRDDILFAGTGDIKRVGRAYVRLTFDNEDGRFPVEAAEITVARSLTSGGDSDYTINGESVRLLDLTRMLAEAGIGTKTYTVISQGMVDRYLSVSSVERRAFFDEACGVKPLQIRLFQTQKKLERVHEHMAELMTIIRELEPRLRLLTREVQKQAEKKQLEAEYATQQATYLHHEWHRRRQEVNNWHHRVENLTRQAARGREKRAAATAKLTAPQAAGGAAPPQPWEAQARRLLTQCGKLIDTLLSRQSVKEGRLAALQQEIARLLTPVPVTPESFSEARQELEQAQEQEIAAERELAAARLKLEQESQALTLLRQEVVRERGSSFLHTIETTAPEGSKQVSEREIRALAY
ncbi:MAG: hypothetical protein AAB538_04830, partial [Patescibacteria group bacterium]